MSKMDHKGPVDVNITFYTPQNKRGASVTVTLTDTGALEIFDDYVNMAKFIIINKYHLNKETTTFSDCTVRIGGSMFFKPIKWNQLDNIDQEQDDHDS